MESWEPLTPSPTHLKFENSPAESYLSAPGDIYPPLFGPTSTSLGMMTPCLGGMSPEQQTPEPEEPTAKKVKKRKSWGQVLPEPKTNLPPRKRAKTEDEKEQRRVERVLRNRRAAQSSRERKRQEVEALEHRNRELENVLRQYQQTQARLIEELQKVRHESGVVAPLRPNGVTFSQELFSSQDGHQVDTKPSLEELLASVQQPNITVNPASISPDECEQGTASTPSADAANGRPSPDSTQHPAAMLCSDLQCRSAEETAAWLATHQVSPVLARLAQVTMMCTLAIATLCRRPLMQIAMSLKAGFSLRPAPSILTTILWLVTSTASTTNKCSTSSTSASSSPTTPAPPPTRTSTATTMAATATSPTRRTSSLRHMLLRKILTCSPNLARPLTDATMAALRLASTEGCKVHRAEARAEAAAWLAFTRGGGEQAWPIGAPLPSAEVLLSLLWAIKVEEGRAGRKKALASKLRRRGSLLLLGRAVTIS